jgi:acetyl-CoA synthetase
MSRGNRLDAYHFYEDDWDSYEQLREAFEWAVPDQFNMATYVCDRWATDKRRVALFGEHEAGDGSSTPTDATGIPAGQRETYTFWQFQTITNRLANYLRDQGVERGDRVGVNAPQRPATMFAHVAAWKLGAVSVPLSTLFGPDAVEYRLDDCDAVAAVVDASNLDTVREARESLPALETVVTVGDADPQADEVAFQDAVADQSRTFETVATDAEDDAIIIYTSGTTGDPKGVRHAHRMLLGHLPLFVTTMLNMDLQDGDVFWTPAEWAWIASLFDVVVPALYYGQPVVAYNGGQFDPETAFEIVERYGVSNFFAPPTALRMMMQVEDTDRFDVDTLRTIASGGESLGQNIVDWAADTFGETTVHEGYGQTEANLLVGGCTALTEFREGFMGRPGPGHEVAIVDPDTAEPTVDRGEVGEIAVRYDDDPVCFVEYWNKPEKTAGKVKNGWLLTEDLGLMDEDGYVQFKSRKDDVIISAGYRIGPEEVEDSVAGHPAAADAAVIGVPDDERGTVPKAFVVLADGYDPTDDTRQALRQHVRDRLAKYEYPRDIEFVDTLPKTATGKVRRASLRDREGLE